MWRCSLPHLCLSHQLESFFREATMDLNILRLLFAFNTFFIVFVGNLVNFFEDKLPIFIAQSFRYGKFAYTGTTTFKVIEIPKSWFKHFYVFSSLFSLYGLYLAFHVYLYNGKLSKNVLLYFDLLAGSNRSTVVDPVPVMVALTLLSLQSVRRFYETWFISIFSKGKINLAQYFIGFIHYWGSISVILSEARGFSTAGSKIEVSISQLSLVQLCGIVIFLWSWYQQFRCAVILASLRKNSRGEVVSEAHKIPRGGLFEVLSSPHLTCEVLVYLGLTLILRQSPTFLWVFFWVLSNQAETALLNHWWYKKTFKAYPKKRKAFIPYIL